MKFPQSTLVILILSLSSCGGNVDEAGQSASASPTKTPNAVAQSVVAAFEQLDCETIAQGTRGRLREYFETIISMRGLLGVMAEDLVRLYPEGKDAASLVKMRDAWHKPMKTYPQLRIDGILASPNPESRRRYRMSWQRRDGVRAEDILIASFENQEWLVDSIGKQTPTAEMVGSLKSQFNLLKFTYQDSMDAVRKQKPADIQGALRILSRARSALIEETK